MGGGNSGDFTTESFGFGFIVSVGVNYIVHVFPSCSL